VPTRDRHADLGTCLRALQGQETPVAFEVVVVDDGSVVPVDPGPSGAVPVRVLRTAGLGPGAARNVGIREATGAVVAFCDDDTVPAADWVQTVADAFADSDDLVGVEGSVWSRPWDWLHEMSLEVDRGGHFWTCNVAYRRDVLLAEHGFSDAFPFPQGEDRDLGLRAARHGRIDFLPELRVEHRPRAVTALEFVRRGRLVASDRELLRRHPDSAPPSRVALPLGLGIALRHAANWGDHLLREFRPLSRPRRSLRLLAIAVGNTAMAWLVLTGIVRTPRRDRF